MTLDKLEIGKTALILKVGGAEKLRCHLLDMGFTPRTKVSVCKTAPLGDPMEISLRGYTVTIRRGDAAMIELRPMEETRAW